MFFLRVEPLWLEDTVVINVDRRLSPLVAGARGSRLVPARPSPLPPTPTTARRPADPSGASPRRRSGAGRASTPLESGPAAPGRGGRYVGGGWRRGETRRWRQGGSRRDFSGSDRQGAKGRRSGQSPPSPGPRPHRRRGCCVGPDVSPDDPGRTQGPPRCAAPAGARRVGAGEPRRPSARKVRFRSPASLPVAHRPRRRGGGPKYYFQRQQILGPASAAKDPPLSASLSPVKRRRRRRRTRSQVTGPGRTLWAWLGPSLLPRARVGSPAS